MTLILGIETSCDETAAAVVRDGRVVLSNVIASQHDLHEKFHGVVPEIASRAHLERIVPVIEEALAQANVTCDQLAAIAVGNRPGLIGSLLVGVSAAKAIAWAAGKPLIGVDHVQAHLAAGFLEPSPSGRGQGEGTPDFPGSIASITTTQPSKSPHPNPLPPPEKGEGAGFPALGLVVSGGHTALYEIESPTHPRLLGKTIDDAAGEAFDKAAVILNLPYPGGPNLDRLAQSVPPETSTKKKKNDLPRSLLGPDSLDFSFSGLKTALLYKVRGHPVGRGDTAVFQRRSEDLPDHERAELAAAFQRAVVDTLIIKLERAIDQLTAAARPPRSLIIGGGVSANSLLRSRVAELGRQRSLPVRVPQMAYCMDNAAMIAGLAFYHLTDGRTDDLRLPVIATASL